MEEKERLAAFERMLADIRKNDAELSARLDRLRAENKTKSATFRQYLGDRMTLRYILSLYRDYGLIDSQEKEGNDLL